MPVVAYAPEAVIRGLRSRRTAQIAQVADGAPQYDSDFRRRFFEKNTNSDFLVGTRLPSPIFSRMAPSRSIIDADVD
jgi:hypothetical protein